VALTLRMCTVVLTPTCTAVRACSRSHHVNKYIFLCDESKSPVLSPPTGLPSRLML
jgi:hypothetical protein